ncbi:MAG: alpha/beta fold hydrolase, partial [Pseudomonadota bacterium]
MIRTMWDALTVVVLLLAVLLALLLALDRFAPALATRAGLGLERLRAGLKTGTVEVDGATISYLHGGTGDEVLLLVHGFGADKDNFLRVAPHLKRRFRLVAVDLPGFGESTRLTDAGYTFAEQATRLHAIAEALGLKRVHVAGSSMGGAIAMRYALQYPDEVASLWLLAPAGVEDAKDSEMIAEYRANRRCLLVANTV